MFLGEGSYGKVFLVKGKAVKDFNVYITTLKNENEEQRKKREYLSNFKYFARELAYLTLVINQPHFCQIVNYDVMKMTITMEKYDSSLFQLMRSLRYQDRYDLSDTIIEQLDKAVVFLHERGIAHNDISCNNILCNYDENNRQIQCYLADFSTMSVDCKFKAHTDKRSIYFDPDLNATNKESDIWAFGATIFHFLTKIFEKRELDYGGKYLNFRDNFGESEIPQFTEKVLEKMLQYDASKRPRIETDINVKKKIKSLKKKREEDHNSYVEFVMIEDNSKKYGDPSSFKEYFSVVDFMDYLKL